MVYIMYLGKMDIILDMESLLTQALNMECDESITSEVIDGMNLLFFVAQSTETKCANYLFEYGCIILYWYCIYRIKLSLKWLDIN